MSSASRVRHIANGDSTAITLREAGLPGVVINLPDALADGPVPGRATDAERIELRARYWSGTGLISYAEARANGEAWERDLRSYDADAEVVMWFEHDLYDQLLLLHHLHVFATAERRPPALSLVCIDRFPGAERFVGLGQLSAQQLASLYPERRPLDKRQLGMGDAGWRAFTSDDPRDLERFVATDTAALPFLDAALRRLLEEYPAVGTGLPRTERMLLEHLADGPRTFQHLFVAYQRAEPAPYHGDWSIWTRLRALARGPHPLVTIDAVEPRPPAGARVALTDDGRRVLAGAADWLALDNFSRWIGGVHLVGPRTWRWDATRRGLLHEAPSSRGAVE